MIDTDVTPVASGGLKNPYLFPRTPIPGVYQYQLHSETPCEQQYNLPPPDVPMYVNNSNDVTPAWLGTEVSIGMLYSAETIKSALPKLKKDDIILSVCVKDPNKPRVTKFETVPFFVVENFETILPCQDKN